MAIAGVKISSLRELLNAEDDDYIVINDNSQNTTKKITRSNFLRNSTNVRDSGDAGAFVQNFTCNSLNVNLNAAISGSQTVGGDLTVDGTITFDTLKDAVENITITKLVDAADGVASNDNDTTMPTTAAVKAYVDGVVSDYRAKSNLELLSGALSKIENVAVYEYNISTSLSREIGVIAHELQEEIPYLVNGEKDAMHENGTPKFQTVNYGKMVPILLAAIQELQREVESLKDRLDNTCTNCDCRG